jgi:hypothetical protein
VLQVRHLGPQLLDAPVDEVAVGRRDVIQQVVDGGFDVVAALLERRLLRRASETMLEIGSRRLRRL